MIWGVWLGNRDLCIPITLLWAKQSPRLEGNQRNNLYFFKNHLLFYKTTAFLGRRLLLKGHTAVGLSRGWRQSSISKIQGQAAATPASRQGDVCHNFLPGRQWGLCWLLHTEGTCGKNEADTAMYMGRQQGLGAAWQSRDDRFKKSHPSILLLIAKGFYLGYLLCAVNKREGTESSLIPHPINDPAWTFHILTMLFSSTTTHRKAKPDSHSAFKTPNSGTGWRSKEERCFRKTLNPQCHS